eukprot:gene2001-2492_t
MVTRYCAATGRDGVPDMNWYFAYNFFRLAGIIQGIKKRVIDGTASSQHARDMSERGVGFRKEGGRMNLFDMTGEVALITGSSRGIGKAIADSLVTHLKALKVDPATGGVLQINGSPTDAAAGLIKKGIHEGLDNSGYQILAEYDTPEWAPPKAQQWAS